MPLLTMQAARSLQAGVTVVEVGRAETRQAFPATARLRRTWPAQLTCRLRAVEPAELEGAAVAVEATQAPEAAAARLETTQALAVAVAWVEVLAAAAAWLEVTQALAVPVSGVEALAVAVSGVEALAVAVSGEEALAAPVSGVEALAVAAAAAHPMPPPMYGLSTPPAPVAWTMNVRRRPPSASAIDAQNAAATQTALVGQDLPAPAVACASGARRTSTVQAQPANATRRAISVLDAPSAVTVRVLAWRVRAASAQR